MSRRRLPPMRLDQIHASLKGGLPRGVPGTTVLVVAALIAAGVVVTLRVLTPEPADDRRLQISTGRGSLVDPRAEQARWLQEALQKMTVEAEADAPAAALGEEPEPKKVVDLGPVPEGHVRVAAVQFKPAFARPEVNRRAMEPYIRRAAQEGAKIVVLPEAALQGYADMDREYFWTTAPRDELDGQDVGPIAVTVDHAREALAPLVRELGIYLALPFIEVEQNHYYSSVVLIDPAGQGVLHYRKRQLATASDDRWASASNLGAPVVDTPYGRIGLMISYDLPRSLPEYARQKTDIVLWSAAFRGDNMEKLLKTVVRQQAVRQNVHLVLANWSHPGAWWQGYGHSRVIRRDGSTAAQANSDERPMLVPADLPLPGAERQP